MKQLVQKIRSYGLHAQKNGSRGIALSLLLGCAFNPTVEGGNSAYAASPITTVTQQAGKVTGKVVDSKGEPVLGAIVTEVGTSNKAITDPYGNFTITNVGANAKLQITYIGYNTETVDVAGKSNISVTLKESRENLDEVVVVGYGSQKKVNLTGAVEQVTSKVLENRPLSNLTQGLQGEIPNLLIQFSDGRPNRSSTYQVRGTGSIGQGGSALVLIDGVEGDPAMLNPADVASVTVLKDAASAAIYGARGTYGVVLITTKNADNEKVTVNFNSNLMVKSPTVVPDVVTDGYEYTTLFLQSYAGSYGPGVKPSRFHHSINYTDQWYDELAKHRPGMGAADVMVDPNTGKYSYYANTDWYDLIYKDHTLAQEQNLSISGGGKKANFLISGRFYTQDGIFNYDPDKYKMFNVRAKGGLQLTPWLHVDNNFEFSQMQYHNPINSQEGSVWYAVQSEGQPVSPLYNPDGTLTRAAATILGAFIYKNNYRNTEDRVLRNTSSFQADIIGKTLTLNGDITFRYNDSRVDLKQTPVPYSDTEGVIKQMGSFNGFGNSLSTTKYLATNIYATFDKTFAELHHTKVMAGWNYEQSIYKYNYMHRNTLIYDDAESINMATGSTNVSDNYSKWRIAGGFFRVNYDFADRYLLEVDGRYDGSSKFPSDQQWGFFPSASIGWRVSQEPWWHVSSKAMSNLKIRLSYGSLGNGNISAYQFQELFNIYTQGRLLQGQRNNVTSVPSPIPDGLTWEKATTFNVGADMNFLDDRLTFTGDYYIRKNTDMYVVGAQPPAVYGASAPKGNYADMTTHGWELSLTWRDQFKMGDKTFTYSVRATLADAKTKVDKYPGNEQKFLNTNWTTGATAYYPGMTLGEIWGFVNDGFLTKDDVDGEGHITHAADQSWITEPNRYNSWEEGDVKFKDLDNSGKIDPGEDKVGKSGDRKVIGNSLPRYTFGMNLNAEWNGISFSAFFQGVGKQDFYVGSDNSLFWGMYNRPYSNIPKEMMKQVWTEENPNAYFPRFRGYTALQSLGQLHIAQSRYLQNAAYVRLKNIQLGYSLPRTLISKIGLNVCRFYVSAENLLTFTPFYKHIKQFDVESIHGEDTDTRNMISNGLYSSPIIGGGGLSYSYPVLKSITFGLSLQF